jgi:hypothetical protein
MLEVLLIMKSLTGEPKDLRQNTTPAPQVAPATSGADSWSIDRGTLDYFTPPE